MILRVAIRALICLLLSTPLQAQQTSVFTDADEAFKNGKALYDQGVFASAQTEFEKTLRLLLPANEPEAELLRTNAELYFAKCAVNLGLPEGEKLIYDFIRKHRPDPVADQALVELATYYYNSKDYEKAVEYFSQVSTAGLSPAKRAETRFMMGYSFFALKKFDKAKNNFQEVKDVQGDYFYPTNYYLGLCHFFEGNYREADNSFRLVESNAKYKPHVPYYRAQILFAEGRYDELINYAEPKLRESGLRKAPEMRQLVGQAYFEKGDYAKALPHLEEYATRTSKLREEEFYQLGYAQYQTNNLAKAAKSFEELSSVDSKLGQFAMYYLADCYLKLGKKQSARTALGAARRMNHDLNIKEEAQFNYAKLSYELKDPREAINALQSFGPESKYYVEAQSLMGEIFLTYKDYKQAMDVIESIKNKTPKIWESYQKVAYLRGLQLIQENDPVGAKAALLKSLENPVDNNTRALSIYWLGDIANKQKDYAGSIRYLTEFLTMAKSLPGLPDESSLFTANYLQGYNYLKQENYTAAQGFFRESVEAIKRNYQFISNDMVKNDVLGDGLMRTGDCLFKRNLYNDAVRYYDEAINKEYSGYVYAIYQKAIIEGLRGRTTEKILALERIPKEFPDSEFADDALLALGKTYQEIGQLPKAVDPLRQLITKYRTKSNLINQALISLGLISYNQGNYEAAISYYKQVFGNNPEPSEANLALAALEEIYINDLGKADDYFAFLETIPGYKVDNFAKDSINYVAARSQFENGNYSKAIEAYSDYLRRYPGGAFHLDAYYQRAESHSALKQYSNALRDYEFVAGKGQSRYFLKALEKAGIIAYNHELDFNKAFTFYSQLETAATDENTRFEAQLGALRSAYRIGNTQAVFTLSNKVRQNPNASQAQVAQANFYLGKMAFDRQDYDNALTSFNEVVRTSDNEQTAEARYQVAYIYYLRRDLETAQTLCINANKESSAYPYWVAKSIILLSDILAEKGDLYNARAALEALLDNYEEDQELINLAQSKLEKLNTQINASSRLSLEKGTGKLQFENEGTKNNNN